MKAISFLGTTNYSSTTYVYGDCDYTTRFFAETLPRFFPGLEQVLIFVTPTVQRHENFLSLQKQLGKLLIPVPIPEGHSEGELWAIFDALIGAVGEGEEVLFDITNSFRSIPLLVFLAATYLRAARQVQLRGVIYGAYEARDKEANRSPVFDLTPFVVLLDWLTATNQFLYTGDARYLAHLLRKQDRAALNELAAAVDEIALGLHLLRPAQVAGAAHRLPTCLEAARPDLPSPFALLADRLLAGYGSFALHPHSAPGQHLARQLDMINWYRDAGRIVHALSMSREWVVSLLCVHFGADMQDTREREEMELLLRGGKDKDSRTGEIVRTSRYLDRWATVPAGRRLRALWSMPYQLANLRNDVLHSGFRQHPKPAHEVIEMSEAIVEELNAIAGEFGVI